MIRAFTSPIPLVLALALCTFIPMVMAAVRVVQIPLGALPEDSLRLASVPVAFFLPRSRAFCSASSGRCSLSVPFAADSGLCTA